MTTKEHNKDFNYGDYPILRYIQDSIIGQNLVFHSPYGTKKVVYCDFTASGRCLSFIEDYIRYHILPVYANTHSVTGHNARQTCEYRKEARQLIKKCMNGGKDDVLIFTANGSTSAIHKLAWAMRINQSRVAEQTVVFIGPYEHHSNTLPWVEYGAQVVRIKDDHSGYVDINHLEEELKFWQNKKRTMLVTMSAASNVTGIITDTVLVSEVAHSYGALVLFDYAAGGPYLKIDMDPSEHGYKDAVVLSPHKNVGGPGTPGKVTYYEPNEKGLTANINNLYKAKEIASDTGILIAKKWMFRNSIPDKVGGGTVGFVSRSFHVYKDDIEDREEGGTPDIIGCIRAALSFKLKQDVGEDVIHMREECLCRRVFRAFEDNPNIIILGSHTAPRLSIFSFVTLHPLTGKLLHHNFISTLLNDLFGIQSRGGCACAGPYTNDLMGISEPLAKKFMSLLSNKPKGFEKNGPPIMIEVLRPGFTRLNLPYFYDDDLVDYIIQAVDLTTRHGWTLLPQYTFDYKTGAWKHRDSIATDPMGCLTNINFHSKNMINTSLESTKGPTLKEMLEKAKKIIHSAESSPMVQQFSDSSDSRLLRNSLPRDKLNLRWFLTPEDASKLLANKDRTFRKRMYKLPFKVQKRATNKKESGNATSRSVNNDQNKGFTLPRIKRRVLSDSDVFSRSMEYERLIGSHIVTRKLKTKRRQLSEE